MKAVMIGLALILGDGLWKERTIVQWEAWKVKWSMSPNLGNFETGSYGNLKRDDMCPPPPPSALMARFTSGHMTKSSMPSMARLGSSYGNLKRDNLWDPPQPSALKGTVYVGSRDKKLYAINGKTGVKLWEFETGGNVDSSPAIGGF